MDYYRRWVFRSEGGLDQKWLQRAQTLAYAGFYARPRRLWRLVRDLAARGGARRLRSKLGRVL